MVLSASSCLVDSSVWIAYFNKDDIHSQACQQILENAFSNKTQLVITTFVIQEVVTVLLYSNKPKAIELFLTFIEENPLITLLVCDMNYIQRSIACANKNNWKPKCSLTDWSLITAALSTRQPLMTFDRQLRNALKKVKI